MHIPAYDTDEQLLRGLHDSNENAFNIFYHRYYPRVLYFSRRYVSEVDAQDIAAEAFIQFWRHRADFAQFSNATNFLYVAARNRCFNLLKRQQVKEHHLARLEILTQEADTGLFHDQVRVQFTELLYQQVQTLPGKTREVFLLSFREGLKPAQIAERVLS